MNSKEVQNVCEKIYDGYGVSDTSGLDYFCQFAGEIRDLGARDVVLYIINNYPLRYALDFLLSSPDLWQGYSGDDWLDILSKLSPRPDSKSWVDQEGGYADIVFLCRYMRVDALSTFCGLGSVSLPDKNCTLDHFKRYPHELLIDELDFEDLDGDYFVDASKINGVRKQLIEHVSFNEYLYEEEEDLLAHIGALEALVSGSK